MMKKVLAIVLVAMVLPSMAMAAEAGFEIYTGFHNESDNYTVKTHRGAKLTVAFGEKLQPYIWGSYDYLEARLVGLKGPQYDILGAGVGLQYELARHVTIFGDVGYFMPNTRNLQNQSRADAPFEAEGVVHYLNNQYTGLLHSTDFETVDVEAAGDFGGEVGFRLEYPVLAWMDLNITGAYRLMRIDEAIRGYRRNGTSYWEHKTFRDLSGARVGIGLQIRF